MPYLSKLTKRLTISRTTALLALGISGLMGCAESAADATAANENDPTSRIPTIIRLAPDSLSVTVGERPHLTASALDARGRAISDPTLTWESTDSTVAIVDTNGTLTAVHEGEAFVTVSSGKANGRSKVKVRRSAIATIEIAPAEEFLNQGEQVRFDATIRDAHETLLVGRAVDWTTSDPSVGTVDSTGRVTARSAGFTMVSASAEGVVGSAALTVTATDSTPSQPTKPDSVTDLTVVSMSDTAAVLRFTEVSDGDGGTANYDMRFAQGPMSWGSAVSVASGTCKTPMVGGNVASVRQCTVSGLSPGQAYSFQLVSFRGTFMVAPVVWGGLSNIASGTTTAPAPAPVSTVTISPASATVGIGRSLSLAATLRDASGALLANRTILWSSSNAAIASVSEAGLVLGRASGITTITATSEGRTGTATITVVADTVVTPPQGAVTPWFVEDFSSYTSTSDLRTTGGTRPWREFYIEDQGNVTLEANGVNIDGLNLSQSMKMSFPDMNSWTNDVRVVNGVADRCDNYVIRPVMVPNGYTAFRAQRHLWFELYVRFSPNWTTRPPSTWGCGSGIDHKTWILMPVGAGLRRWEVKFGAGDGRLGPAIKIGDPIIGGDRFPNVKSWLNDDPVAIASNYWNGQWTRVRAEVSLGTAGTPTGIFRVWIGDTLIHEELGVTFPSTISGFDHMQMGANRNHGAGEAMSFSWGMVRIFDQNPGW